MSAKPIFVATHPRACSTAFERVFMTCRDTLHTVHEPFGDAWYFGPERLHDRFENDELRREDSGFSKVTYKSIFDDMEKSHAETGKRLLIKDMIQYWMPPNAKPASVAPSLVQYRRGVGTNGAIGDADAEANTPPPSVKPYPYDTEAEEGNPTIVPEELLKKFHFTFLIRHPRSSISSYYRCTIPPLSDMTGFHDFRSDEAGYLELRQFFDYARRVGLVGPKMAGAATNGTNGVNGDHASKDSGIEICVIDADDLLDNPYGIIEAYCKSIGVEYSSKMLKWDSADQAHAKQEFEKWKGFHEDALQSDELKPRTHVSSTIPGKN